MRERRSKIIMLTCYNCGVEFETDIDLDMRLKEILRFPNEFWNLCDKCKLAKYDYTKDTAVAFQLMEGYTTEHSLLGVGLTHKDIERFRQAGIRKWGIDFRKSFRRKKKERR